MRSKKLIIIAFLGNIKYDARCLNMAETLSKAGFIVTILNEKSNDNFMSKILERDKNPIGVMGTIFIPDKISVYLIKAQVHPLPLFYEM